MNDPATGAERRPDMIEPRDLAYAVVSEVADEPGQVGDFLGRIDMGDNVSDFRFASTMRGYEGWQWSVTLYHDVDRDVWTVNESSLVPDEGALLPPQWIPWKDRLVPGDLAVTDSIGTEPDDPRLEDGFRRTKPAADSKPDGNPEPSADADGAADASAAASGQGVPEQGATEPEQGASEGNASAGDGERPLDELDDEQLEREAEVAGEFELSRRRVLTPLGRAQAAERWYAGPHGPKSLSTKAADGSVCQTCGFFVPLTGELNLMFGVCANKWSPDDGRVVSRDHGCGQHSEIEPPTPSNLWVQSKPAFDDLHIDIIAQAPRVERGEVEVLENATEIAGDAVDETEDTAPAADAVMEVEPSAVDTVDEPSVGGDASDAKETSDAGEAPGAEEPAEPAESPEPAEASGSEETSEPAEERDGERE